MANLNEEDCRNAMVQFVSENCCYGTAPAKEMTISNVVGLTALHVSEIQSCLIQFSGFRRDLYSRFLHFIY